jgi:hypothetical protein
MFTLVLLLASGEPKSLKHISEDIASSFPASAPAPPPALRTVFPEEAGGLRRAAQGFYGRTLLSSLLGAKTKRYTECGAEEAVVARYRAGDHEEHALIVRTSSGDGARCVFDVDKQGDSEFACDDDLAGMQRRGVTTLIVDLDGASSYPAGYYVKVRGHDNSLGGGAEAEALACALARLLKPSAF